MNRDEAASATANYLRERSRRRFTAFSIFALLIASVVVAQRRDDWSQFDHRCFAVIDVTGEGLLKISLGNGGNETVRLLGIRQIDRSGLNALVVGHRVTLLLQSPQTRDAGGTLRAFAFLDNQNLGVELVKGGLARADRQEKSLFDGVIAPAETEARKRNRGSWNSRDERR